MLQTGIFPNYQTLPGRCTKQTSNPAALGVCLRREEMANQVAGDLSALYPQSVLNSSDGIGWQNVRALHFRHNAGELTIPASDDHCVVLNLGASLFINVNPGKRRFEGKVFSSEAAIIPA